MPANLTPEYFEAEEKFKEAVTPAEKVSALEEMLRAIPKHKGTEKMQADIKRRLSRLRKEAQKKQSSASKKPFYYVEREGAGQVVLCGPPNAGKSQLLANLSHAEPKIGDYPFTTRTPQPGMMSYEDIQIQLVDTPPLAPEIFEAWQTAMVRQSDAALLLFDVNDPNLLEQTDYVLGVFEEKRISLAPGSSPPILVLGNKVDRPQGEANFAAWSELYRNRLRPQPFSALRREDLSSLSRRVFEMLEIVRIYTKAPGKKRDEDEAPFVLKKGSTVVDAARTVHKDLERGFKYARVWGEARFDGQMVERSYVLQDGDLVEIHM